MKRQFNARAVLSSSLLFSLVMLSACSSQPTLGERMMEQSAGTSELGRQWLTGSEKITKGEQLVKDGNELIEDARDDMRDGEDKVSEGKKLVEEGKKLMEESERQYKQKFPNAAK